MPSPTLKTVRSLKDLTLEACAAINTHLNTSSSPLVAKHDLKPLTVELRLLGGTLYSLECFITELVTCNDPSTDSTLGFTPSASGSASENEPEWPLIDGCELLVNALKSFHPYATSDGIKAARLSLLDIRSKLAFVLGSSESLDDLTLQFSLLGSNPISELMVQREQGPGAAESPTQTRYDDEDREPTPEDVSAWLTILNSSDHNREPAEYNRETALVQSRRITEPKYRTAATKWPKYAEMYWQKLRPQVCSLFRIQKSYSFVQWALEYARETYPRTLGSMALSPRLLLELTDALCDGSISSLHIAAALGLPNLCRDLLSMGADINQSSLIGTPLFCALMGSKVLVNRMEPESWTSLLMGGDFSVNQGATTLLLIDAGADCTFRYHWKNATEEISLAGLAFWAAMTSKHEAIFTRIVKGGGNLDTAFNLLLKREALIKRGQLHRTRLARLLTYVYDLTLLDVERDRSEYAELQNLVSKVMSHTNAKFAPSPEGKIETLSDGRFPEAVRNAVLDFNVMLVERLIKDPRFDPNLPGDSLRHSGTILHMATEGSQLEIMDILIRAGADLRARDSNGRTPIMVVEEVSPLAKLVLEHSAPTYDTDKRGRTIWHLAAATNDTELLKFLWDNDPFKARNLEVVCERGCTPLMASFTYISTLEALPKGSKEIVPSAARFLLDNCQGYMKAQNSEKLACWAIEWGSLALLQKIFDLAPQINAKSGLLLRSLNISASPDLVALVLDKCQGLEQFPDGTTAAETVITNVKLVHTRFGFFKPSAHPSCFPSMTRSAYMQLLTPEVLRSRDDEGRGLWARFCDGVLRMLDGPSAEHPSNLYFLSGFIRMAISCLVERGALANYERETGQWAIARIALAARIKKGGSKSQRLPWERWQLPFVSATLEALMDYGKDHDHGHHRSKRIRNEQYTDSVDAALLVQEAVALRQPGLVKLLVQTGIDVHKPWDGLVYKSIFETFLYDWPVDNTMIHPLLSNTKPQEILSRQHDTFKVILCLPGVAVAVEVVGQLIERGMDVNHFFRGSAADKPMVVEAISESKPEIASLLIERGADPSLAQPNGYNALIAAADFGQVVVLEAIIEKIENMPGDFNWLCTYEKEGDVYNALQLAAAGGHRDFVSTLLEATPLDREINSITPRDGRSPAHLAASSGSLDCVKILMQAGANFQVKDSAGRTPLFLALLNAHQEVIEYLKERLLDLDNDQDLGISLLGPTMSSSSSDSEMTDAPSESNCFQSRPADSIRLGIMIARLIRRQHLSGDSLFKSLLDHASKEDLESAIMPCGCCTLLSYTAAYNLIHPMLELLELGFKGFVASCKKHWPRGYNALLSSCLDIQSLMTYKASNSQEKVCLFFEKCLDAYLQEGRLWFHLPTSPIYAICRGEETHNKLPVECRSKVLQIFINHLSDHAEEYWALMRKSGLADMYDFSSSEDTRTKVLRFAVNLRSQFADTNYPGLMRPDDSRVTALHGIAKSFSKLEMVLADCTAYFDMTRLLVKNGADVNAQNGALSTPLHLAAQLGCAAWAEVLLQQGADPNIQDATGASPLARAVASGSLDMVRCLLAHGADPETFTGIAVGSQEDMDVLNEMIRLGLDPYCGTDGKSFLSHMIIDSPHSRSYVLNGNFDFYRLAEHEPFFLGTVLRGEYELKAVLRRLPQECRAHFVNYEPQHGICAGRLAIRAERLDYLELLLDAGFDVEREWCNEGSALMWAGSIGASESFKLLVRRGARLSYSTTDSRGQRIVRSATKATKAYPKLLQWLLVGRHSETKGLEQHPGHLAPMKPWSGPRKAAYRLTGAGDQYPWLRTETMMGYLGREARLRRNFRGKVLPVSFFE
ncbi:hypothetical protein F66182_6249 [Fusarium sp. NRRL 66182]|nr:hypothetical protein F66182_6249 [Fusarium sp. NRRL 66182]